MANQNIEQERNNEINNKNNSNDNDNNNNMNNPSIQEQQALMMNAAIIQYINYAQLYNAILLQNQINPIDLYNSNILYANNNAFDNNNNNVIDNKTLKNVNSSEKINRVMISPNNNNNKTLIGENIINNKVY